METKNYKSRAALGFLNSCSWWQKIFWNELLLHQFSNTLIFFWTSVNQLLLMRNFRRLVWGPCFDDSTQPHVTSFCVLRNRVNTSVVIPSSSSPHYNALSPTNIFPTHPQPLWITGPSSACLCPRLAPLAPLWSILPWGRRSNGFLLSRLAAQ